MRNEFSTAEVGTLLGYPAWRVRRLFESGILPEPPRFAGKRAIPREMLPQVLDELRRRDWRRRKASTEATSCKTT